MKKPRRDYIAILVARPAGRGPLAERYFLQVVGYGVLHSTAVFELTADQYELAAGFVGSKVDPSSPGFDLATDPRSVKYDRARTDAVNALLERFLARDGVQDSLPLTHEELRGAKGVVTFNFD